MSTKINTLVSKQNVGSLLAMPQVISSLAPTHWSLYQFWPLGPAARVREEHVIDDEAFMVHATAVTAHANAEDRGIRPEVVGWFSRRATYPIVHHDGEVFVHSSSDPDALIYLCSIFEAHAREKIDAACSPERPGAADRYSPVRVYRSPG
jgi:hypothetical protein